MLHFPNSMGIPDQTGHTAADWSGEISTVQTAVQNPGAAGAAMPSTGAPSARNVTDVLGVPLGESTLNMNNSLPAEVVDSPTSLAESYKGSMNAMLSQNIGNYIVASFLVGTQGLVSWEGILYEVGNNYLTIYQESRDRYIVADIYSVKFVEFYDTRRREMCDNLLRTNGWRGINP